MPRTAEFMRLPPREKLGLMPVWCIPWNSWDAILREYWFHRLTEPRNTFWSFSGDHIYKMNYARCLMTISSIRQMRLEVGREVPMKELEAVWHFEHRWRWSHVEFERNRNTRANLLHGYLHIQLEASRKLPAGRYQKSDSNHDFGKDIIPTLLFAQDKAPLYAYTSSKATKGWETIDSGKQTWIFLSPGELDLLTILPGKFTLRMLPLPQVYSDSQINTAFITRAVL